MLADTEALVFDSYREAGVDMPPAMWGRPWQDWLVTACDGNEDQARKVHDRKNEIYVQLVREHEYTRLSGVLAVETLHSEMNVGFITSASMPAAYALVQSLGFPPLYLVGTGCSVAHKAWVLERLGDHGLYMDDNHELGEQIVSHTGWTLLRYDHRLTAEDVIAQVRAVRDGR